MHEPSDILPLMLSKLWGVVPITPIAILLGVFLLVRFLNGIKRPPKVERGAVFDGLQQNSILTDHEKKFYPCLIAALPQHHVFVQVSFGALLNASPDLSDSQRTALRNRFNQKRADFVVCQKDTFEVVAIVELDDRSHDAQTDQERDNMLGVAQYRVERFSDKDKPWRETIAKRFSQLS